MRQIIIKAPGGLEHLALVDAPQPAAPARGEVTVRISANSLNFHDYLVASNEGAAEDGRIPMADGAGTVEAVGEGVTEFAVVSRLVHQKGLDLICEVAPQIVAAGGMIWH